jgi:hypothetical protein
MPQVFSLTIIARRADGSICSPKTKKNHSQIVPHLDRSLLIPSKEYLEWERIASDELIRAGLCKRVHVPAKAVPGKKPRTKFAIVLARGTMIDYRVTCRALFYRARDAGDANGFYQAAADFLQHVGILKNDALIRDWDGSRLLKDPANPRIEIRLTQLMAVEQDLFAGVA